MVFHRNSQGKLRICALAASCLLAMAATSAQAETGSASAQDVSIHINLLGIAQLDVDPQAPVGFSDATEATSMEDSLPSIDQGGTLLHVSTGTLASEVEYSPGVSMSAAGGKSTVENLDLSAVSLLSDPLLSISADAITSSSPMFGYCLPQAQENRQLFDDITFFNGFDNGNLVPGGDPRVGGGDGGGVTLGGLGISILGIPVPDLPVNPPPNTAVDLSALGIAGATLILNEQTIEGDGVNTSTLTSNAIHLTLDVAGLVTADVVVAHSSGELDCTQ